MKTNHEPIIAPEEKSSKVSLFFMTLALAALLVSAVVGGAAFMIYRQFATMPGGKSTASAHVPATTRLTKDYNDSARSQATAAMPMNRPVAAEASDRSDYRYADNTVLPPAAARRVIAAWRSNPVVSNVPPPLIKTTEEAAQEVTNRPPTNTPVASDRLPLTDPESRYIINPATGRVIGVDGTAGAAAEARLQQVAAARAIPVEVRVATPVQVRAAIPVTPGEEDSVVAPTAVVSDGSQYVPVRRAQPVNTAGRQSFDAAAYLASDDRPVLRGQAVVNPTSRAAGYRHDFSLPAQGSRY